MSMPVPPGPRPDLRPGASAYADQMPRLHEFAALPAADPQRARLRDDLVLAFLPVVRNLARRCGSGRRESVEELEQVGTVAITVGAAGFVVAAGLWWTYFDTTAASSAATLQRHDDQDADARGAAAGGRHDLFVYGHLPLTLGIAMVGVGVEDLVVHPDAVLPSPGSWTLAAGLLLFVLGSALILGGSRRSIRAIWPWPAVAVPVIVAVSVIGLGSELLFVGGLAAICLILAVQGTRGRRARVSSP